MKIQANGIEISYEIGGSGPPLLLIMGLAGQLTDWHPGFVESLERHFTVIRFDNRDAGLSTYSTADIPSRWDFITATFRPSKAKPDYRLTDLADDSAALLEALDIERAHVVGMSMGGMIAQLVALRHPERVASLCSIMSNTGDKLNGRPTLRVFAELAKRDGSEAPDAASAVELTLNLFRMIGGRDWDENEQRERTAASIERAYNPAGVLRQSLAIAVAKNRTKDLGQLGVPALVVHGLDDTLVRPSGGIATANALPNSRLVLYPRMGHDIPATRHAELTQAIVSNADRGTPALAAQGLVSV